MQTWQKLTFITLGVVALHGALLWATQFMGVAPEAANQRVALRTRSLEPPSALVPPTSAQTSPIAQTWPTPPSSFSVKPSATLPSAVLPTKNQSIQKSNAPAQDAAPTASTRAAAQTPAQPAAQGAANTTVSISAPSALGALSTPSTPTGASGATPLPPAPTGTPDTAALLTQLPSQDADHADTQYSHPLPAISTRLGEAGKVMLRVQVGLDGRPQQVLVLQTSGYQRVDDSAVKSVQRWRFRPGTRQGVPEVMWVNQPVTYALSAG